MFSFKENPKNINDFRINPIIITANNELLSICSLDKLENFSPINFLKFIIIHPLYCNLTTKIIL